MKFGLVLGAGGTVGLAYHAGVLRAIDQETDLRVADADLIVGTSAGAVVGAYLRTGWTTDDFWQLAMGTHPSIDGLAAETPPPFFQPAWRDPLMLLRRGVGSAYVAGRAFVRVPTPWMRVPAVLGRVFPGGLFSMTEGKRRFAEELPDEWPHDPLWLCAFDLHRGQRVVLGRPGRKPVALASLRQAVTASCAIPGVYDPVRIGSMTLVDGGAWSTTNLDLAANAGCNLIVGVAPMAYDTAGPLPSGLMQLVRRVPARMLAMEMAVARRRRSNVLLIRPSAAEVRIHGTNLMRNSGWADIARAAYDSTARLLATERFQEALAA